MSLCKWSEKLRRFWGLLDVLSETSLSLLFIYSKRNSTYFVTFLIVSRLSRLIVIFFLLLFRNFASNSLGICGIFYNCMGFFFFFFSAFSNQWRWFFSMANKPRFAVHSYWLWFDFHIAMLSRYFANDFSIISHVKISFLLFISI